MSLQLFDEFARNLKMFGARPAIDNGAALVTYDEMSLMISEITPRLREYSGFHASIEMPKSVLFYCVLVACWQAGVIYCPLNLENPNLVRSKIKERLKPVITIRLRNLAIDEVRMSPRDLVIEETGFGGELSKRRDDIYVMATSGSTGDPKLISIGEPGILNLLSWAKEELGLSPTSRIAQYSPISFDLSVLEIYSSLITGACLVPFVTRSDRLRPSRHVVRREITHWISVPSGVDLITSDSSVGQRALSQIKVILCCGDILPPRLVNSAFTENPKLRLFNTYGPTEATVLVTAVELSAKSWTNHLSDTLSVGYPIPNVEVSVETEEEISEIVIMGDQVATEIVLGDSVVGPNIDGRGRRSFATGDLGRSVNNEFFFHGRRDFQIKIQGNRIELSAVENVVSQVTNCSCVAFASNEKLFVATTSRDRFSPDTRAEIANQLPAYMVPSDYVYVEGYPMSPNGKIDRNALTQRLFGLTS